MTNSKYNRGWGNLRSLKDIAPEEKYAIQSAGGKASAAAKKERRRLEALANRILNLELPCDEDIRAELEAHGIDPTCDAGIVLAQVKRGRPSNGGNPTDVIVGREHRPAGLADLCS